MKIHFVTNHRRKLVEIQNVLPWIKQVILEVPELQNFDQKKIVTAKLASTLEVLEADGPVDYPVMVDETGLYLDALSGFPGPYIKWMLGVSGPEKVYEMVAKLGNRSATAKTIIGYKHPGHPPVYFTAEMAGSIVAPSIEKGYGWDSIFQPHGFAETFAEMGVGNKKMISMRRTACEKLQRYLNKKDLLRDLTVKN